MLEGRLPDSAAAYPDPSASVNLRASPEDVEGGQTILSKNCFYDGGLLKRFGSSRINSTSLGAFGGRGGIRFYPQTASAVRLIAYDTKISALSDTGVETNLTAALTSDQDTHFWTWTIQDSCYVCNGANPLGKISNASVYSTITGVNVPASPLMARSFLDRLFVASGTGVTVSNPRVDSVFAPSTSSWSYYQPATGAGNPTALHIHSGTGAAGDPIAQLLIFQSSAVTALEGTDFGSDVTLTTPPATWDAQLIPLDPITGTNSPYSVCSVPGMGSFWFTNEFNVAWLPFSEKTPRLIGDMLFTRRTDVYGLNHVNTSALGQVSMIYHDRKLKLFLPVINNTYSTIQYWLDLRPLQENLSSILGGQVDVVNHAVWSGPHEGQSIRRVWVENQRGDTNKLMGLEGNSTTGMFAYELNAQNIYKDAVGTSDVDFTYGYKSIFNPWGNPTREKYMPYIRFDVSGYINTALVSVRDLHGTLATGMSIVKNDGTSFVNASYGNGLLYGNGVVYGLADANNVGNVWIESQMAGAAQRAPLGDALQIEVTQTAGPFQINQIVPDVSFTEAEPVS